MKSFSVTNTNAKAFVEKVNQQLSGRELGKIVSIAHSGNEITIRFSKLGTTELSYKLSGGEDGFTAELHGEKIAFAHNPFKSEIERKLTAVLKRIGASVQ